MPGHEGVGPARGEYRPCIMRRGRSRTTSRVNIFRTGWKRHLQDNRVFLRITMTTPGLDSLQSSDQRIDFPGRVVKCQRRADRGLDAHAAQNRLRTVVA